MPLAVGIKATGAVRNLYAILRQVHVGRTSLDRLTSQEEQHEGKSPFNNSGKIWKFGWHSRNLFSYISTKAQKDFASYVFALQTVGSIFCISLEIWYLANYIFI